MTLCFSQYGPIPGGAPTNKERKHHHFLLCVCTYNLLQLWGVLSGGSGVDLGSFRVWRCLVVFLPQHCPEPMEVFHQQQSTSHIQSIKDICLNVPTVMVLSISKAQLVSLADIQFHLIWSFRQNLSCFSVTFLPNARSHLSLCLDSLWEPHYVWNTTLHSVSIGWPSQQLGWFSTLCHTNCTWRKELATKQIF